MSICGACTVPCCADHSAKPCFKSFRNVWKRSSGKYSLVSAHGVVNNTSKLSGDECANVNMARWCLLKTITTWLAPFLQSLFWAFEPTVNGDHRDFYSSDMQSEKLSKPSMPRYAGRFQLTPSHDHLQRNMVYPYDYWLSTNRFFNWTGIQMSLHVIAIRKINWC